MLAIIDWAAARVRMILAMIALTLTIGALAYVNLPKEGEPDLEVPALFISVPFPGISASDSEQLLIRPMEQELNGLTGLRRMSSTAAQGYAGIVLEFEFGWDKTAAIADVRDRMGRAQQQFPQGADSFSINEFNFSQFPVVIVAVSGSVPERTLLRAARDLERRVEGLDAVLSADIAGVRDEMVEVIIDPLRLEAYNVTAGELIQAVTRNNQLVAAGEIEGESGRFSLSLPGNFAGPQDIYDLPIKVVGDRVVTLGDLATIQLTFEDRAGTARFQGETTLALQVVKRKGFNIIDTVAAVRGAIDAQVADWPEEMRAAISVTTAFDRSVEVGMMISQLEGSVMTAVALVMIVVLASLGTRSALLVGFVIPSSFLMAFMLFGIMGVTISNIVMFGLILAVGILVDGAIVVAEYADKRIAQGDGPMAAYVKAAKRMFWPVVSSTATTLCAFLPMLFWPGVAGEFMGLLPITLIFVLTASLVVALVFLPVLGGLTGRIARRMDGAAQALRRLPWVLRLPVPALGALMLLAALRGLLHPPSLGLAPGAGALVAGLGLFALGGMVLSVGMGAVLLRRKPTRVASGHRRTLFGWFTQAVVANPVMPVVAIAAVAAVMWQVFVYYGENNRGVEFFMETDPEQGIIYVRARGNLSLAEKDALLREVEAVVLGEEGVASVFAFAGRGGLNANTAGAAAPRDAVGQIQFQFHDFTRREHDPSLRGRAIVERLEAQITAIPGIQVEFQLLTGGPASSKPVHLRLAGADFARLEEAVRIVDARMRATPGLSDIEDTRPLPGIDWEIRVDTAMAGRFGADVATVGGMIQLVTRGLMLDTMRVDTSDEEIEIRVRLPQGERLLSTLDTLRVQTPFGLVPLSNFVTREAVPLRGQIDRVDESRTFDIKAAVAPDLISVQDAEGRELRVLPRPAIEARAHPEGSEAARAAQALRAEIQAAGQRLVPITATERIDQLTRWLEAETPLPPGVTWEWTGEMQDQAESEQFLVGAFGAAMGLMFIILLAQFNSFYNSVLVLSAVVLSTTGVLIGMLVMNQPFSIIMTGTGIMALAAVVVNNNIILIDTYQDYARFMPRIEAIVRTAEARLRPVMLTTITTMAGLTPMMLGLTIDFQNGGYSINAPAALWWKQLATTVVFGLAVATVLTLVVTPALLALRYWVELAFASALPRLRALAPGRERADRLLRRRAGRVRGAEIIWEAEPYAPPTPERPAEPAAEAPARRGAA